MMEAVGHDTKVNFRVNVMFCLCLWCPNGVLLTKTRIRYIKAAVFQMPYIQVRHTDFPVYSDTPVTVTVLEVPKRPYKHKN